MFLFENESGPSEACDLVPRRPYVSASHVGIWNVVYHEKTRIVICERWTPASSKIRGPAAPYPEQFPYQLTWFSQFVNILPKQAEWWNIFLSSAESTLDQTDLWQNTAITN